MLSTVFRQVYKLEKYINSFKDGLLDLLQTALESINAFFCGLYNSIIDTIKGIFQIIGILFKGIEGVYDFAENPTYYWALAVESLENIIGNILEIDFFELFKNLFFFPFKLMARIAKLASTGISISVQEFSYFVGYLAGFLVETAISLVFTGGTLSLGRVLAQTFVAPAKALMKGLSSALKAANGLLEKILKFVQYVFKKLRNPRQMMDDLLRFLDDVFGVARKGGKHLRKAHSDPTFKIWGAGKISHPKLWKSIIADLKSKGAEVKFSKKNMTYGPNPSGGKPGVITITHDASITALMHEAKHFQDDLARGFPGFKETVYNPVVRWEMEFAAYMEEINFLRKHGEFKAAKELIENARKEKKIIEEMFNTKL